MRDTAATPEPFGSTAWPYPRLAVLGGGAWGTALAVIAAGAGRDVTLWCRRPAAADAMAAARVNAEYLPDAAFPETLTVTADLARAVGSADAVLLVTPSKSVRELCRALRPHLGPDVPLVLCAKGIEVASGLLLTDVAAEELPGHAIAVLSGPTFAAEAAAGHPTAVTIASDFPPDRPAEESVAARLAVSIGSEAFRPYVTDDIVGVEVGGAMKNVIAIACGMMTGAGFAANTRAALITRGLDEMKTLSDALGGRRETVTGLSGAGDLTLTCSSTTSRNMSLGVQLGKGLAREVCFDGRAVVVEGEVNAVSVTDIARRHGLTLPICEAVREILHDGGEIGETFARLWAAPLEAEARGLDLTLDHPADEEAVRRFAEQIS
ncbi:MAG: NAD(P)H-dependent glycerol-3-phosphate dehydrogenase [Paracoccaceae bacterium]